MKKNVKFYLWISSAIGFVFSSIIIFIFLKHLQDEKLHSIMHETEFYNTALLHHIQEFENQENQLISMLAQSDELRSFILDKTFSKDIKQLFFNIARSKNEIMQIRYLDKNAQELIRVDQDRQGNISIKQQDQLQLKAKRYYVQDFLKLPEGKIGYSKFDLNIEHGKIEFPYKPTVRIGKGVFINGELQGIVVINYFMGEWLNQLSLILPYNIFMIGFDNSFMYHFDPKWEWSAFDQPPKDATHYPQITNLPNWQEETQPYYLLGNSLIAKKTKLFSSYVLVGYDTKLALQTQLSLKAFEYALYLLSAFLIFFLPLSLLLYSYVRYTKQNAQYQKKILDNLFDALIVINKEAIVQHVNHNTLDLFGYTYEELIGKNIKMLVPSPYNEEHDNYIKNCKKQSRTIVGQNRNIEALTKDGELIPISLAITQVNIDNNIQFIGVVRDLREIKKLEAMNEKQTNLLQHQSKLAAMGEMIGAIAHQWRQPLNELSIRIQKLRYAYQKEQVDQNYIEEFIDKNRRTIEFMSQTIDDFRNFFRIEKEKKTFLVKNAIEETISLQNAQLSDHRITINILGEEFSFNGYKTEFQQVIMNIISNAKDNFVSRCIQDPLITFSLKHKSIYIQDNGGGDRSRNSSKNL